MAKKNQLEDFLTANETTTDNYEEVETLNFERDTLYEVTVHGHHTFDGKYGPSVVITYELDSENPTISRKFKAYLNGYEANHFNNFIAEKELPLSVKLARVQRESEQNEGRVYNKLVIATV